MGSEMCIRDRYSFRPSGDVFAAMDLGIQFPQSKKYESAADIRSLVKAAILDTSKTDITLVSSNLVKDGKQGDPETLFALAIERFDVRLKLGRMQFAEFNTYKSEAWRRPKMESKRWTNNKSSVLIYDTLHRVSTLQAPNFAYFL